MAKPNHSFEEHIPSRLRTLEDGAINGAITFQISGPGGGQWTVDGRTRTVMAGKPGTTEFTLHISSEDWDLLTRDPTQLLALHFAQRLSFDGNPHFLTKIKMLLT
jgi:hypothetical protein